MMAPDQRSNPKVEKVIGTEITPEIRALGESFGSSPFGKCELEKGLLPLFAIAARDQGVRLEEAVLSSANHAVGWYQSYCLVGGSNYDFIPIAHSDFVTVSEGSGLQLTVDGASWMRERVCEALTAGSSDLEAFIAV